MLKNLEWQTFRVDTTLGQCVRGTNVEAQGRQNNKVQTVRQVNTNEVGDSQMMAISDEGVGLGSSKS